MGCSCRRLREVKKAPASLYRGFKCVSEVQGIAERVSFDKPLVD